MPATELALSYRRLKEHGQLPRLDACWPSKIPYLHRDPNHPVAGRLRLMVRPLSRIFT